MYEVDQETVCQYTGLTDKNRKKIFKGDILKYIDHEYIGKVIFKDGGFKINWGFYDQMLKKDLFFWVNDIEVIGSVFDNPDLFTTAPIDSD